MEDFSAKLSPPDGAHGSIHSLNSKFCKSMEFCKAIKMMGYGVVL